MATDERAVALTIDDGPDRATTPEILDVLDRHEARATFFLVGSRAERHPELVREIVRRGHEIANHMWEDVSSRGLDSASFERRLLRTHRVLSRFAAPRWLRPAGGLYSDRIVRRAEGHGYRIVLGTVYPFDTVVRWPGLVARFLVAWSRPGSILILHDGEGRGARTAEALRRALPDLQSRGYRITTLSALASAGDDFRRSAKSGSGLEPAIYDFRRSTPELPIGGTRAYLSPTNDVTWRLPATDGFRSGGPLSSEQGHFLER